jgi:hypothetical protein
MRSVIFMAGLAVLLALFAGCPRPLGERFTSADPSGSRWSPESGFNALGDLAGADDVPGEEAPREVVEPDVIRRDGSLLYVLNQYRGLSIVDLSAGELLTQVPTMGFPRDLYLAGDRAYVLVGYAHQLNTTEGVVHFDIRSRLYVVDVSTPDAAGIVADFDLEGDFMDSRLVGDVLYAVSAQFEWQWDGVAVAKQQHSESWVTSVDVSDPASIAVADELSVEGYGTVIQATSSAIFVAAPDWASDTTTITYVDITDPLGAMAVAGSVTVKGLVADRFKMDAWNGVLRVVSTTQWPERNIYITTVDLSDPNALAALGETHMEDASGETLFATRFDGDRAYIVTYLVVDPLFVIDLSDPADPRVAGALEVPGWSTHIEPQGDRLIALGVDDTNGRRVCVSLFDVTDPANPGLLDRESFGEDWAWSSAYEDVKAFTVLDDVLIVPFSGWTEQGGFDRLQFLSYTPEDLALHGHVDLQGQILRSFAYDGAYYGVTTEQLATIDGSDLNTPEVTARLTLAEYVADFHELAPDCAAEVVSRFETGTVLVRTVTPAGAYLGEVELAMTNLTETHAYGDSVVLIAPGWDQEGFYTVAIVDCSEPTAPVVTAELRLDVEPYSGWYWDYMPMRTGDDAVFAEKSLFAPWIPWWYPDNSTFVAGDILALRCFSDDFDSVFGDEPAVQGLAFVNLAEGTYTGASGLGYSDIDAIAASGTKLYIGTKEPAGIDLLGRGYCAHYLRELDPATLTIGPPANVPGAFVQYDAASDVFVLADIQYEPTGTLGYTLESVAWNGAGPVLSIDSQPLPENSSALLGRGGRVYFQYYDEGTQLASVAVAATGELTLGASVTVTDQWALLVDAQGDRAYAAIADRAIASFDFSDVPALSDITEVMSGPLRIRFGAETAYAPLGYAGLARLPL